MARLQSQRDAPNTSREYETIYILRPNTPNEAVAEVNTKVRAIIEGQGGKILKVDNWGKRRLAYEVAKERKGIYLYWQYLGSPGLVEETERNLRLLDHVVRYLTIKVDENIDVAARPTELDDTSFERAATTAADEEDIFLKGVPEAGDEDDEDDYNYEDESAAKAKAKAEAAKAEVAEGDVAEADPTATPTATPDPTPDSTPDSTPTPTPTPEKE